MTVFLKAVAVAVAVAGAPVAVLIAVPTPAQASLQADRVCEEGSRRIDAPGRAVEVETRTIDGERGRAEITLRSLPSEGCYWGLLEGPGVVWVERVRRGDSANPESNLDEMVNEEDTIRHTAAAIAGEGDAVRVCGRALDGTWEEGGSSSGGASVGTSGASVSASEEDHADTYSFSDDTVCTRWAPANP